MTHENEPAEPNHNQPTAQRLEELAQLYDTRHDGRYCRTCEVALIAQMLLAAERMIAAVPQQVERTTVRELALLERNRKLTDTLKWLLDDGAVFGLESCEEIRRVLGVQQ